MLRRTVFCLFLANSALAFDTFKPTFVDLETMQKEISRISAKTKLIVLSDRQHRLQNTRAATALIAQAVADRFPNEKICLLLETTEKIDERWVGFKKSDGSEKSYTELFEPLARKVSNSVDDLGYENAGRIFVEPSFFVASYLKRKAARVDVYGVDVDYSDKTVFSTLYNNSKTDRKLNDNQFAKIFITDRNKSMADKTGVHLQKDCTRAVLSAGNMHIFEWSGDKKFFSNYTGKPIPGVLDLIDKRLAENTVVFNLYVNRDRSCPEGEARTQIKKCAIEFSHEKSDLSYFDVELPKDFYSGRIEKVSELRKKTIIQVETKQ